MHPSTALLPFLFVTVVSLWISRVKAQDAPVLPGPALTGSVSIVNDYLFRGLSQTSQDPALQAGAEYGSADSWYVGGWGSNVSWLSDLSSSDAHISNSLIVVFARSYGVDTVME